jgi:hypothetical protein
MPEQPEAVEYPTETGFRRKAGDLHDESVAVRRGDDEAD